MNGRKLPTNNINWVAFDHASHAPECGLQVDVSNVATLTIQEMLIPFTIGCK